jgi:glycosyltransferase involved in cell wall biosynthesis
MQRQFLVDQEGCPPKRTHVIYNGVNLERWAAAKADPDLGRAFGIDPGAPVAGIVACLRPEKNHPLFIRAAAKALQRVPEAHFLIVGDGPGREELVRLVTELGMTGRVHFTGNRDDVPDMIALMDVLALTSVCEAFPMAILEAMASAKPVVATRVGAIPEAVIDGQNGYLVPPGDVEALADRLAQVLADRALATRLGRQGLALVSKRFSRERMVGGYERLFLGLAARKFRRPETKIHTQPSRVEVCVADAPPSPAWTMMNEEVTCS